MFEFYTNYIYIMIYCLLLTIIIEGLFAIILGLKKRDLLNVLLVNILTNPLLNAIHPLFLFRYGKRAQIISLIVLEFLVVIVEGFIYHKVLDYKKINGYKLSFLCNVLSFIVGTVINSFIF